ncbi:MAG: hypothetical protein JWM73_1791 [Solirubrobacterales bacterium]|nr:hypothetical protein [Solirubrobacterales bacterium]
MRRATLAVLALLALLAPAASGQDRRTALPGLDTGTPALTTAAAPVDPNALVRPTDLGAAPLGHRLTPHRVLQIARGVPKIADMLGRHPGYVEEAYQKGASRWQVSYFDRAPKNAPRKEIGQVLIDDATGRVAEAWTGFQVAWTMARGYPGAFGRIVTSPWIWVPLSILFVLPFVDPRRWRSWLHLDLLVLSAFSVSLAFFDRADIGISVPWVYPLLVYLLVRMAAIAVRRHAPPAPVRLLVPVTWLAVALIFLLGFRIGLNATNSNVIDVGYAGVIGADRLVDGDPLYGAFPSDNEHGDTYGPVVYEAYVPFEQAKAWTGRWDDLPAAHGAAIAFDLLCVLLLFLIGRRVRGPDLGVALAYAWAAYPFTLYTSNSNSNDALVAALVLLAVLLAGRPALRGGAAALAGLSKFAPLALAPVLATHGLAPGRRVRGLAVFAAGFVVTAAIVCLPLLREDLSTAYDRTIGFQAGRGSPFSVWGLYGWDLAQSVVQALSVVLALVLAFVPRRQDIAGLAAACAAVLIGLQLGVTHWFYLYVPWFFGLVMIALLGRSEARVPGALDAHDDGCVERLAPLGEREAPEHGGHAAQAG